MNRLYTLLSALVDWLAERDRPVDVIETMSARERADLPSYHPVSDRSAVC